MFDSCERYILIQQILDLHQINLKKEGGHRKWIVLPITTITAICQVPKQSSELEHLILDEYDGNYVWPNTRRPNTEEAENPTLPQRNILQGFVQFWVDHVKHLYSLPDQIKHYEINSTVLYK